MDNAGSTYSPEYPELPRFASTEIALEENYDIRSNADLLGSLVFRSGRVSGT